MTFTFTGPEICKVDYWTYHSLRAFHIDDLKDVVGRDCALGVMYLRRFIFDSLNEHIHNFKPLNSHFVILFLPIKFYI
jgi:hypothetical protein